VFLLLLINSLGETNRARKRQKRQLLVWYIQTDRHWRSHEQQEEAKILTHVTKKNERKCLSTSTISLSLFRLPSKITQKKRTCNNNNNIQLWCVTAGQALFIFPFNILLRLVLNSILWNYFSNPRKKIIHETELDWKPPVSNRLQRFINKNVRLAWSIILNVNYYYY
jgi:hypothetical protein